ncbi:hypothetical protein OKA05_01930 [Luteolibacter arcticus]|uniref:Uncharacterized protein n=1 Tax=Luteolibacter arcticus TaxID=1581411 RepID=A0ABT3GCX2_9BACT|nr:hypothetical protein [Luteolibacter arcticus]MCW1921291.1 hypothetical protein [Luteolibacter arcticus]
MKLSEKKTGEFTPHPETESPVKAVIVDVTPLKKRDTEYGVKEEFRLVFETEEKMENGDNFTVRSRLYSPSLNEKANFRKDIKKLLGRDLTAQELQEFDTESLIGMGAKLMIDHTHKDNETYANIVLIKPDESPMKPGGKYVRLKDREQKSDSGGGSGGSGGKDATYKKAPDAAEAREPWQKCKVHVGKHKGVDLGDLDQDAVLALLEKWLPKCGAEGQPKPTADDKRLKAALEEVKALLEGTTAAEPEAEPEADY